MTENVTMGGPIPTTFSVFRNAAIKIIIHYNKSGVHLLPAILVENEVQPFEDKEITVFSSDSAKGMDENQATISNLGVPIAFVVSLFSFFFALRDIKLTKEQVKILNEQLNVMKNEINIRKDERRTRSRKYLGEQRIALLNSPPEYIEQEPICPSIISRR